MAVYFLYHFKQNKQSDTKIWQFVVTPFFTGLVMILTGNPLFFLAGMILCALAGAYISFYATVFCLWYGISIGLILAWLLNLGFLLEIVLAILSIYLVLHLSRIVFIFLTGKAIPEKLELW